jgi:nucleotide-binding universal stress UspA family protein
MTSKWNILAPIASSHRSEECIQHAASVATAFGADLHLLRVIDPRDSIERGQPEWCSSAEQNCQIVRAAMESSPAATIAAHAESMDADLVVMTSSVYGKWSRLWRRSVTEQVMRLSRRRVCVTSERSASARIESCV